MDVVPFSVATASRAWDEQHLDLDAAADQIRGADTAGFTSAVSGAARRFVTQWERHAERLGTDSEARADGLRVAIQEYVATDDLVGGDLLLMQLYLAEQR